MAINNERVSSFFTKILLLALLVGLYFGYTLAPVYFDNYNIKQKCIAVYRQKDLVSPSFTKERKARLVKQLVEELNKEYDLNIKPKDLIFKTTRSETYMDLHYTVKADLLLAAKVNELLDRCEVVNGQTDCGGYLVRDFDIHIEGNP